MPNHDTRCRRSVQLLGTSGCAPVTGRGEAMSVKIRTRSSSKMSARRPEAVVRPLLVGLVLLILGLPGTGFSQCPANTPCVSYYGSTSATTTSAGANSLTFSFTVPPITTCDNAFLVVPVSLMLNTGNVSPIQSVTWGGTALTLQAATAGTSDPQNDNSRKRVEMWTLGTPTPQTANIVITLPTGAVAQMVAGAVLLCGVDQTNPFIGRTFGNNQTANTLAQVGLASASYAMLLDVIATDANVTATVGNAETNTWNLTTGTLSVNLRGSSSRKRSTGAFEVPTYNLGTATLWALGAMTLNPWSPTPVDLESFEAVAYEGGAVLRWHTGYEGTNLGFRVYRETGGDRVRVNPDIIAGAGLSFGGLPLQAGYSFSWFDPEGRAGDVYWLEDVEAGGENVWYGPFTAKEAGGRAPLVARSRELSEVSRARSSTTAAPVLLRGFPGSGIRGAAAMDAGTAGLRHGEGRVHSGSDDSLTSRKPWDLAVAGAAKIVVDRPGWYRVTFEELRAAGFEVADPSRLQLYARGVEQAIVVTAAGEGEGPVVPAIEFFGLPDDTPSSGTRTYWLVEGGSPGLRVIGRPAGGESDAETAVVPFTVEVRERLGYFAGLLNGEKENFFGQAIAANPARQTVTVDHLDGSGTMDASLRVAVQGVTGESFEVEIGVNGTPVGTVKLEGAQWRAVTVPVPVSLLTEGDNTVTLSRMDDSSVALVDHVRLTYPRVTAAAGSQVAMVFPTAMASRSVRISGFATPNIRILDVTDHTRPVELGVSTGLGGDGYFANVVVPSLGRDVTLLALCDEQVARPAGIVRDTPSDWHDRSNMADMVVIGPAELLPAADPLRSFHESEGLRVAMVDVQDVYDEFSFGSKDPAAIRAFLEWASTAWEVAPRFVLLLGDGSYDPRDYLGYGEDLVPTKLIDAGTFETASDDWFVDFSGDGIPEMAIGRLPVGTPGETAAVVGKIVERAAGGMTLGTGLLVADLARSENFTLINQRLEALLPTNTAAESIAEDEVGEEVAREILLDTLATGVDFVSYSGHGTVDRWRGDVLTTADVPGLRNGHALPIFTMMNCLNGLFQEPLLEGLGEALIRDPDVGAAAVWASSGTTPSSEQELLVKAFYQELGRPGGTTLGEAAASAKQATQDLDARRTWILLGDPAMKVGGAQ